MTIVLSIKTIDMIQKNEERVTVIVKRSRKKQLLEILKHLDFVEVESKNDLIRQIIKNAPKRVPINEKEIMQEVKAVRNAKK